MTIVDLLDSYVFPGIIGNGTYELLKKFLHNQFGKSVEDLYLDAAKEISNELPSYLTVSQKG
jgi:hypothetical protein